MRDKLLKLEINRLINEIQEYLDILNAKDYFSDNPSKFIKLLKDFLETLDRNIEKIQPANHDELLQFISYRFVPLLRYVQRAQSQDIPWSLVPIVEKMIHELLGKNYIITIRPRWHWNYTVSIEDLSKSLQKALHYFTLEKDLFKSDDNFFVISFPVLEKNNLLLHTIFSHEIGHFYENIYTENNLNKRRKKDIANEIAQKLLDKEYAKELQPNTEFQELILNTFLGMVREIIPDIVGYYLMGPSIIYSLFYFSLWNKDDETPLDDNDHYPPLKYRIRVLYENYFRDDYNGINKEEGLLYKYLSEFNEQLDEYLKIRNDININFIPWREAYELFQNELPKIRSFVKDYLNEHKYTLYNKKIDVLIRKIENSVPPNEQEMKPVELGDIFLAGWIQYFRMVNNGNDYIRKQNELSKLLIKASQAIFIHTEYLKNYANS